MASESYDLFVPSPRHVSDLLVREIETLGAERPRSRGAGAELRGSVETAYRICLWSRIGTRVVLNLLRLPRDSDDLPRDELYRAARGVRWEDHLEGSATFAVRAQATGMSGINTHFLSLVVKDAVVDRFRDRTGSRPNVDSGRPDLLIWLYLSRRELSLGIDLSGGSLHRRGYRARNSPAPLKEHVAASLLLRGKWPGIAAVGGALVDPMCGSGTIVIEGAMMAADIAPGLVSSSNGPTGWAQHDGGLWKRLVEEARDRRAQGLLRLPPILGYDSDPRSVEATMRSAHRAGLAGRVAAAQVTLRDAKPPDPADSPPGLVAVNPPYGERIGDRETLPELYAQLGRVLIQEFPHWQAAVLTADESLSRATGLRARKVYALDNGPIPCILACFDLPAPAPSFRGDEETGGPRAFRNRLAKNLKRVRKTAEAEDVSCYRVYDGDLPDYAVAIDVYENRWVTLQEYAPPREIPPHKALARLEDAREVVVEVLQIDPSEVYVKRRVRQRGGRQYDKAAESSRYHEIGEDGLRFLVNFSDYLDVGIFLDGRLVRSLIRQHAVGAKFLNLFSYTGAATVCAAAGGAQSTVSVDTSHTYLDWGRRNLELNGLDARSDGHLMVRADCLSWLRTRTERFDLIFAGAPTYSRGTGRDDFDVQGDHAELLRLCAGLLLPGGRIVFSTNYRRFRLNESALEGLTVTDISLAMTPFDFTRNRGRRRIFEIGREPH